MREREREGERERERKRERERARERAREESGERERQRHSWWLLHPRHAGSEIKPARVLELLVSDGVIPE